jgi:hypothetical protein
VRVIVEARNQREPPQRTRHEQLRHLTAQAAVDEALQERRDRVPAAMLARPAVLAVVEAQDRVLGEAGQQRLDVAGVEGAHVASELEQQ